MGTADTTHDVQGKAVALAQWKRLILHKHFAVDGTLIEAWASLKSFVLKDGSGKPPEVGRQESDGGLQRRGAQQ